MTLHRSVFLTSGAVVALAIGTLALAAPGTLLESKGVALPNAAAMLWVRQVGVLIFGVGLTLFLVRNHSDSPTLRAVLLGNAAVQIGLLPIEIVAAREGVITRVSGVVPSSLLHVVLAAGFLTFACRMVTGASVMRLVETTQPTAGEASEPGCAARNDRPSSTRQ